METRINTKIPHELETASSRSSGYLGLSESTDASLCYSLFQSLRANSHINFSIKLDSQQESRLENILASCVANHCFGSPDLPTIKTVSIGNYSKGLCRDLHSMVDSLKMTDEGCLKLSSDIETLEKVSLFEKADLEIIFCRSFSALQQAQQAFSPQLGPSPNLPGAAPSPPSSSGSSTSGTTTTTNQAGAGIPVAQFDFAKHEKDVQRILDSKLEKLGSMWTGLRTKLNMVKSTLPDEDTRMQSLGWRRSTIQVF